MRFMHYDDSVEPPVAYFICPRDCAYAEGVKQRSLRTIFRRTLARLVVAVGRRTSGW